MATKSPIPFNMFPLNNPRTFEINITSIAKFQLEQQDDGLTYKNNKTKQFDIITYF